MMTDYCSVLSDSNFVRELGAAERIYCREHTDYGNQTLVQILILSDAIKINETNAQKALLALYHSYCPVLGFEICPSNDKTTLVFKRKERQKAEQDLIDNLQFKQNVDWHELFEQELNHPFNSEILSRWIILNDNILLISIHHAIMDAKNLFYITRRFLSLCSSSSIPVAANEQLEFLEPMEKYLFDKYAFEPISDLEMQSRPIRPDPLISRTHARHFYCSTERLVRLQNQCHLHGIRLNSILTTIAATAYYLACDHEDQTMKTLKIHMMVNIRPQLQLDFDRTGMFVTVFDCFIDIDQQSISSLWSKAIKQHEDLHQRILNKEYLNNCKNDSDLLKMINQNDSFSSDDVHFAFSNLGLLPNTIDEQIREEYFGVSLIENRWTSSILVGIGTIDNRLCWTITYNIKRIEKNFIKKWIEHICHLTDQI